MNVYQRASAHAIHYERPAATFFEGALLGNGGLGAVVTTRPDAIVIHFGHNNVWDIRIAENNRDRIGTFDSLFARLQEIPAHYASLQEDPWYREYVEMAAENYSFPYPRPMPCGSLLLGFDRRRVEVLGHTLHVHNGLCEIRLLVEGRPAVAQVFVDQQQDALWLSLVNGEGAALNASVFNRIKLIADPQTPPELPAPEAALDSAIGQLSFRQTLPCAVSAEGGVPSHLGDRAFRLSVRTEAVIGEHQSPWEGHLGTEPGGFVLRVQLDEGLETAVAGLNEPAAPASDASFAAAFTCAETSWRSYWSCSGVALSDSELEAVWYRNLYFYQCAVSSHATCPGLFANWSYGKIGAEWHGDYHMNYNTQQPFWLSFSSNHVDKHLAYVDLVERILPVSKRWAQDYYGLRGAYYPHSAYPVEMSMMPYPVPHWGWEICETPWTVQSLWWHYLYTMDKGYLADRAFTPMKEAVLFMVDYMKRPEAGGEAWGDDRYHIFPTVVPELYELTPGFSRNRDCIVDLALTKFLFLAFTQACEALGRTDAEAALLAESQEILQRFPAYPTAMSQRGTVWVSVPEEDPEVVYNVPTSLSPVFPGEEYGLHSAPEDYERAVQTYRNHRNEGGNELVFANLAGARLGQLDLGRFKRQIAYCMLPNGTCTDMLLESGGRYSDTTPFDYMGPMGVWFENFALPAVINECLLQSYNGVLRLFPNWPIAQPVSFTTLRAVGGFLVSADAAEGAIRRIEIQSEAGSLLRLYNPWQQAVSVSRSGKEEIVQGDILTLQTAPGENLTLAAACESIQA